MILVRENAPRHHVPNLYRFGRLPFSHIAFSLSLSFFPFARSALSEKRSSAQER